MGEGNILIWLLLGAIISLCAWWHIRENRLLVRQWQKDLDPLTTHLLTRFAWSRTVQLLAALSCSALVIAAYDKQLTSARHTDAKAPPEQAQIAAAAPPPPPSSPIAPVPEPLVQLPAGTAPATPALETVSAAGPAPQNALEAALMVKPVENKAAPPSVVAPETAAPPPAVKTEKISRQAAVAQTVFDVYSPERNATDRQSTMDDIKKRYEDIMVIHMFLKKCGKVQSSDYHIITSSLSQEMVSVNAPERLYQDIDTAAKGSYKEIYSRSPCNGNGIAVLHKQYNEYIELLSASYPGG